MPLVIGCLGVVSSRVEGFLNDVGIRNVLGGMQASSIIGTTLIPQKMLSCSL